MEINKICKEPITEVAVDASEILIKDKKAQSCCIFLVAGRLIYRKGIDFLLDALMRIPKNLDYQVKIVGDGPELKYLRTKCNSNARLTKHVHFTGAIPYTEMEKEYAAADVFIMPSIRETTGTVLLEAMSKGIPVITINKFGGATLLDANTGWLYGGSDKESYIENLKLAIMECIMNPDERIRRGKNACKKAENYTWQKKNEKYQRIYKSLFD